MEEKLRYALIGCGRIAPNHLGAALECPELQPVALCDCEEEKCHSLAQRFSQNGLAVYGDYREMLERERPALVAIATDSGSHGAIALDCLRAGANLIIEKPIALSLEEADGILALAQERGLVVSACHQNRFNRAVRRVRQAVENGDFGKMHHLSAAIRWNRGAAYYQQAPWRGRWETDGGALMNQCIHNIDLLRWLSGQEVLQVFAYTDRLAHPYLEAEDFGVALVRLSGGAYGVIEGSVNIYPQNLEETLCIFGERGTAKLGGKSVNRIETFLVEGGEAEEAVCAGYSEEPENVYGFGHLPLYRDVVGAVLEGRAPLVDGVEGRKALELVLAIYRSAARGEPVSLPLSTAASREFIGRFG